MYTGERNGGLTKAMPWEAACRKEICVALIVAALEGEDDHRLAEVKKGMRG